VKYTRGYPNQPFASIADARTWVARFVQWSNEEHRHSAILFVTPRPTHRGEDIAILSNPHRVYANAQRVSPKRWSRHKRNWTPIEQV
jgi:putative transposase